MDKKIKQYLLLITFSIALYTIFTNFSAVLMALKSFIGLFMPVIIGIIVAFVLNVPMKAFERLILFLFKKSKVKPQGKTLHAIGITSTYLSLVLIVVLVCTLIIPELAQSVKSITYTVSDKMPDILENLKKYNIDTTSITDFFKAFDYENLIQSMTNRIGSIFDQIVGIAASTVSVIGYIGIACVVSVYVLLSKEQLIKSCKKITYAYLNSKIADKLCYLANLMSETYSKFLSGQCVEAIILGFLMFLTQKIFGMPYAEITGIITGIFSFIPYVGSALSFTLGFFLVLILTPGKILIYSIVYFATQFVENQFIYPHVVGNSVGLSPLLTLVAVLVGGKMFGVVGILFFIPLTAVLCTLLKENTKKRLNKKNITI